jgi:hypothetical protein
VPSCSRQPNIACIIASKPPTELISPKCLFARSGKFSAFRVDGRWKRPSGDVTCGDLEEDFLPILNVRDVEALLAAAKLALRHLGF